MFDFFCGMSENLLAIEKSRFFLFVETAPSQNRKNRYARAICCEWSLKGAVALEKMKAYF